MKKKSNQWFKAGVVGAVIGAVGTWFLYGTEAGKKRREEVEALAARIKNDVLAEARRVKAENEPAIREVIETVAAKYRGIQNVDATILSEVVSDLKNRWSEVKNQFEAGEKGSSEPLS
jgi:gas vesicle protein